MMIKKTTLFVLLCAVALGAGVYYFDWKKGGEKKPDADASKPAFSLQASDIVSFTVSHPAQSADVPLRFEKHDGDWRIVQPVSTEADQPTVAGIVDQLADDRVAQTEPGSADRRKAFGLDPPRISIDFSSSPAAKSIPSSSGNQDFTNEYRLRRTGLGTKRLAAPASAFYQRRQIARRLARPHRAATLD